MTNRPELSSTQLLVRMQVLNPGKSWEFSFRIFQICVLLVVPVGFGVFLRCSHPGVFWGLRVSGRRSRDGSWEFQGENSWWDPGWSWDGPRGNLGWDQPGSHGGNDQDLMVGSNRNPCGGINQDLMMGSTSFSWWESPGSHGGNDPGSLWWDQLGILVMDPVVEPPWTWCCDQPGPNGGTDPDPVLGLTRTFCCDQPGPGYGTNPSSVVEPPRTWHWNQPGPGAVTNQDPVVEPTVTLCCDQSGLNGGTNPNPVLRPTRTWH